MGLRTDLPKITPDDKPSLLNWQTAKQAFFGTIIGELLTLVLPTTGFLRDTKKQAALILGATVGGAFYGALKGKKEQEGEQGKGRTVSTPGYFNLGTIGGWVAGDIINYTAALLSKSGRGFAAIPSMAIYGTTMAIGSILRKNSLQHDFDKSAAIRNKEIEELRSIKQAMEKTLAQAPEQPSYKNSVNPQESAELAEKQTQPVSHEAVAKEHKHEKDQAVSAL